MKKPHIACDEELIGRFFDGELGQKEQDRLNRHLKDCPSCQEIFRDNRAISALFRGTLEREISQTRFSVLETRVLERIRQKETPWWKRLLRLFFSNKLLIPATAAAALILFIAITKAPTTVSDPSALIGSFSGEVSSVMIIETPKSHQTIIWYKESS